MASYMFGATGRDQPGKGLARDPGEREVDNIRVAEEIIEKGLNSFDGIRSA
jgi:hypothetical protein